MGIRQCIPRSIEGMANEKGLKIQQDIDGRYRIIDRNGRDLSEALIDPALKRYGLYSDDDVKSFLSQYSPPASSDIDGSLSAPFEGLPSGANSLRAQGQLNPVSKGIRAFATALQSIPVLTPIGKLAEAIEGTKGFPIKSKLYDVTQAAKHAANRMLAHDEIALLGKAKNSFNESTHTLARRAVHLTKEQERLTVLGYEAFTKNEIAAAGGFLDRAMTPQEIVAANTFTKLKKAADIPLYIRMNEVIAQFVRDRKTVLNEVIPQLERELSEGKLPPQAEVFISNLKSRADLGRDWGEVVAKLGLAEDEQRALKLVRLIGESEGALNLPLIYRYATAPELKPGFKTGLEQFIAERKMSPEAIQVMQDRAAIIEKGFEIHAPGISAKRVIGAQLPVFRQLADAGIFPNSARETVLDLMPEGNSILTRRVVSGHIDPAEMNPAITAHRIVRNLIYKKTLDPAVESVQPALAQLTRAEPRYGEVFANYINELEGHPHDSFVKLNEVFRTIASTVGVKLDDAFADRIIRVLTRTAYQSTIPFRAALVLRNFTQTAFFTLPVIGPEAWFEGMRVATGWTGKKIDKELLDKAMDGAVRAGAIDPNVLPIWASDRVLGLDTRMFGNSGPTLRTIGNTVEDFMDMGFSVYRYADDWGRSVAYYGGRYRVNKAYEQFWKSSKKTAEDLEKFKIAAKVKTFDETIENQFEQLIKQDKIEEARQLIGKNLADKTHLLYGNANHPAGWDSVFGRLFGQFGTFPVQYAHFVLEGVSRGTLGDRAEFVALHSLLNAGVVAGGSAAFGLDLTSWATLPSLTYTGGPYAEVAMNLWQMVGGSEAERNLARSGLAMMLPTIEHPQSVVVPGSYFIGDVFDAFREDDPFRAAAEFTGFRFLRPGEKNGIEKMLGWLRF